MESRSSTGFSKPEDPAFPAMLELFARTDVDLHDAESGLMPIHIDDEVSSLSAILLDEEYYRLLAENRTSAGGVAVLSVEGLIPFKAKAWLDLSARRAGGQAVEENSVKKHRNDVCRLATLLAGGERPAMSEGVRADMRRFMEAYESDFHAHNALEIHPARPAYKTRARPDVRFIQWVPLLQNRLVLPRWSLSAGNLNEPATSHDKASRRGHGIIRCDKKRKGRRHR